MILPALTVHAYDLVTGAHIARIPYGSCTWGDSINEPGDMTVSIPLSSITDSMEQAGKGIYATLRPWRAILAVQRGPDHVLHAGPVTSRTWDPVGLRLSLTCGGGWTLLGKRLVLNHGLDAAFRDGDVLIDEEHPAGPWLLALKGSYRDIARGLVAEALKWGALPISLPAVEGGPYQRNYGGYDLATVSDRLSELADTENGDEIRFTPRVDANGRLTFLLESEPEIIHHKWTVNATLPGQRIYFTQYGEDGGGFTSDVWAVGGKDDDKTVMARRRGSTLTGAGYPAMQTANKDHTTVSVLSTLQQYAAAQLAAGGHVQETFALKIGEEWAVEVGDWMDVRIGDMLLGDQTWQLKITDVDGSTDSDLLTLQARRRT